MEVFVEILTDFILTFFILLMLVLSALVINYFYITFLTMTLVAFRLFLVGANLALVIAIVAELIIDTFLIAQIDYLAEGLTNSLVLAFNVAVAVLGITYVLSAFWVKKFKPNLVDWKRAVAWLLGGLLFYNSAGYILTELEDIRRGAGTVIYQIFIQIDSYEDDEGALFDYDPNVECRTIQSSLEDTMDVFSLFVPTSSEDRYDAWGCLTNRWEDYLTYDTGIDSIDIAYAVISAGVDEANQGLESFLPITFFDTHFGSTAVLEMLNYLTEIVSIIGQIWGESTSVSQAFQYLFEAFFRPLQPLITGVSKMYLAVYLSGISIIEQTTYFVYTIAYAGVFWSFILMIPLALFKPLEKYALGLLKEIVSLSWSFLFSQFMLALGVSILLVGAGTQLWFVINVFALCALWPISTALLTATNSLTNAIKTSSAIGGKAAQAAVQQGMSLAQQTAVAKAGAIGNNLGISGADKDVQGGGPRPTSGLGKLAGVLGNDLKSFSGGGFDNFKKENRRSLYNFKGPDLSNESKILTTGNIAKRLASSGNSDKDGVFNIAGRKTKAAWEKRSEWGQMAEAQYIKRKDQLKDWVRGGPPSTSQLSAAGQALDSTTKEPKADEGQSNEGGGSETEASKEKKNTAANRRTNMPGFKSMFEAFGLNPEGNRSPGAMFGAQELMLLGVIATTLELVAEKQKLEKELDGFKGGLGGT